MADSENERIKYLKKLKTPQEILEELPLPVESEKVVTQTREEIQKVLDGKSQKLVVIVGPCSIHDPAGALDYANFIKSQKDLYADKLIIVMRTYFSKPRTTNGWKGLINDPDLNNTYNITKGIYIARKLLLDILKLGVPCSMEQLDTILPQYFNDLLSWSAIGARTTESQVHRELASGISMPVGFKNTTNGNIDVAINGIQAGIKEHSFIGCDMDGVLCEVQTKGNPYSHIILRGSDSGPNYFPEIIKEVEDKLVSKELPLNIFVDFSHGNSRKKYQNQHEVAINISQQIIQGNRSIKGVMIESNLVEGNQSINNTPLVYGQSITDECINIEMTQMILEIMNHSMKCSNLYGEIKNITLSES